jgi:hypothetical protein
LLVGHHRSNQQTGEEMTTPKTTLISDGQSLDSAAYKSGYAIQTYDDGFGPLWISRNSIGIDGIVRARTWSDAYEICEDEFFPEASETIEEIVKEYGFTREHVKVVKDSSVLVSTDHTQVGERFATNEDYPASNGGKLLPEFVRWETIETPNPEAWSDNEIFQENFGFRPNGPNVRDTLKHGIYSKDLNGDSLDMLTPELIEAIGIVLVITGDSDSDSD